MNNIKNSRLGGMKTALLASLSCTNQYIHRRRTLIRAAYVGAICLVIAAALVGGLETAQGAAGGTRGKPGDGGSTKTPSFSGMNLGVLPGHSGSSAYAVSESGSVVGDSWFDSNSAGLIFSPAYWYFNGQTWDIYALPKGQNDIKDGTAYGIAGPAGAVEYVVGRIDSAAMIWIVTGHTFFSGPERLDTDLACSWSSATSVNVHQVAVGICDDRAAIWTPGQAGYSTNVLNFPASGYTEAMDINDDGVIVGRDCISNPRPQNCHAFALKSGSSAVIQLNDQINGNPYSYAAAVSDVVTVNGKAVVYVTGSTTSAGDVQTGTRWTVPVSVLDGSSADTITQVTLTKQWCSGVNNTGDAVCTTSGGGRQSSALVRNGVVNNLKPPKRATDAVAYDLAHVNGLPTYVVGVAQVDGLRATVWVIDQ